jgi:peptidoglycan/LPS O-acetylase OafA/YrhL
LIPPSTASAEGLAPPGPDLTVEPPPRATLANVQALRALAAFMVVLVHLQALAVLAGAPAGLFEFGNGGVDLFFVISGFIMVFTTGRRPMGPAGFFGARLRRIAPLYWSVTLAVFLGALLAPRLFQGTQATVPGLVASLLFFPAFRPDGTMRPIVFVGWTLNYEMAFYVLFAAALLLRRRWQGVAAACLALAGLVLYGLLTRSADPLLVFYTQPMILEFGAGMLLGLAWPKLRSQLSGGAIWGLAAAALAAFLFVLAAPKLAGGLDRVLAFGVPAVVMVGAALALEKTGLALRSPWALRLGNASYAIYLSHFFVTQAVILAVHRIGLHGALAAASTGAVALLGVALAGLGLHYGFERPMDRWLGEMLRRPSAPHPVVVATQGSEVSP